VPQSHPDPVGEGIRAQRGAVEQQDSEAVLAQESDRVAARLDLGNGTDRGRRLRFDTHDRRHRQRGYDLVSRD